MLYHSFDLSTKTFEALQLANSTRMLLMVGRQSLAGFLLPQLMHISH